MNIINTFLTISKINSTITINTFLFFLQKLPFCPKKLKYSNYKVKKKLLFLTSFQNIFDNIIASACSVLLGCLIPFLIIQNFFPDYFENKMNLFYKLFLCLFLGMNSLTYNCFNGDKKRYICIRYFSLDPKNYFFYSFISTHAINIIASIPVYIILLLKYDIFTWLIFPLIFIKEVFSIVGEYIFLRVYDITKQPYINNFTINSIFKSIFIIGCIGLIFLKSVIITNSLLISVMIIALILSLYATNRISRYNNFLQLFLSIDKTDDFTVSIQEIEHESSLKNVKLTNNNIIEDIGEEPYFWLSNKFFERILHNNKSFKLLWGAVILAALIFTGFIILDNDKAVEYGKIAVKYCWISAALCFYICKNARIINIMFNECDSCMLRYNFYREKNAIFLTYISRLSLMVKMNLKNALPLAAAMLYISICIKASVLSTICAILPVFMIAVFLPVHYMFIYYYIQPFSIQASMPKPIYTIEEFVFNMIMIQSFLIPNNIIPIIISAIIIVVYLLVSVHLIRKNADHKFILW